MRKFLILTLLLATSLSFAALPPRSKQERKWSSTDHIKGCITHVNKLGSHREGRSIVTEYEATVNVYEVLKTLDMEEGEVITVSFNKIRWPDGQSGPVGQNRKLKVGTCAVMYLNDDEHGDQSYTLLDRNGWEYWAGPKLEF